MSFLGSSKLTSIFGYVIIVAAVLQQAFAENPLPQSMSEWFAFGGKVVAGIALRFAKDSNVSNAPLPTADAKQVPVTNQAVQ